MLMKVILELDNEKNDFKKKKLHLWLMKMKEKKILNQYLEWLVLRYCIQSYFCTCNYHPSTLANRFASS